MSKPVRLMERSVFSDRMVFVRAVRESGWMGDVELAVYDSWFTPILESNPSLKPDGFIYLQCTPSTCMERYVQRQHTAGMHRVSSSRFHACLPSHSTFKECGALIGTPAGANTCCPPALLQ